MDRIVSTSKETVLEQIFDKDFTTSNFGFRRGKSQHQAIAHVKKKVEEGYDFSAFIDLQRFFDEIPHNLILKLIRRKISDEKLVTLIARALKAGVIVNGVFEKTTKGCPQGSPLSPMLSNIVLNEMDQELERRGLNYCRWADDSVILLKSERAAQRVMDGIIKYLEGVLKLPVNKEKSKVAKFKDITFLGICIVGKKIRISKKAMKKFKRRVKELTKRNNPRSMYQIIKRLSRYLRGWISYFRIQEMSTILTEIDVWIRNRLRIMIKAGLNPKEALKTWVNMKSWRSIYRKEVLIVLKLDRFRELGLTFLDDYSPVSIKQA